MSTRITVEVYADQVLPDLSVDELIAELESRGFGVSDPVLTSIEHALYDDDINAALAFVYAAQRQNAVPDHHRAVQYRTAMGWA